MIPTMKKYPIELIRNQRAATSVWSRAGVTGLGILILASAMLVETPYEVENVAYVFLRQSVIDPRRHGGALHAVQDQLHQPAVRCRVHKPRVPQIARAGKYVHRVRAFAVRLPAVAPGAALQKDL